MSCCSTTGSRSVCCDPCQAQAAAALELWAPALSPDAAARLDLKAFLANPSVGGEAQMAAEMWCVRAPGGGIGLDAAAKTPVATAPHLQLAGAISLSVCGTGRLGASWLLSFRHCVILKA